MDDGKIIEVEGLYKSFGEVKAVDDLTFCVKRGELFAFLGVNGAGKSTTINIISGILKKDLGRVTVCGSEVDANPAQIKSRLGIVFQNSVLDRRLSAYDNLKSRAAMYGIFGEDFNKRLKELCEMLELEEILKRPLFKLSGGQKRRIDIARAIVHGPELLILDEPTTGLDPKTRLTVWAVVEKLRKEKGLTVFFDGGKKAAEGTPHLLKNEYASDFIRFYSRTDEAEEILRAEGFPLKRERGFLEAELKGTRSATELILRHPQLFEDYEILKGNMDNVFLKVTGKDIKED